MITGAHGKEKVLGTLPASAHSAIKAGKGKRRDSSAAEFTPGKPVVVIVLKMHARERRGKTGFGILNVKNMKALKKADSKREKHTCLYVLPADDYTAILPRDTAIPATGLHARQLHVTTHPLCQPR